MNASQNVKETISQFGGTLFDGELTESNLLTGFYGLSTKLNSNNAALVRSTLPKIKNRTGLGHLGNGHKSNPFYACDFDYTATDISKLNQTDSLVQCISLDEMKRPRAWSSQSIKRLQKTNKDPNMSPSKRYVTKLNTEILPPNKVSGFEKIPLNSGDVYSSSYYINKPPGIQHNNYANQSNIRVINKSVRITNLPQTNDNKRRQIKETTIYYSNGTNAIIIEKLNV